MVITHFDENGTRQRLENAKQRAQKTLDSAVLQDSNYYCPLDTSALQKSAIMDTVIGTGEVKWTTPYAKKQYYNWKGTSERSHNRNPNASDKWFETAKANRVKEWENLARGAYGAN